MIKKILKGLLFVVGGLIIIAGGFYLKVYFSTESRLNKVYDVTPQALIISPDSALLQKGQRLSVVKGCVECHGEGLSGKMVIDDPALAFLPAPNLTKGKGGLPPDHGITDWVLALKHGIRRDGKPLWLMPSHEFAVLSEEDMKAIIAYAASVPPVDNEFPKPSLGPVGRILTDLGKLPLLPAEMINHDVSLVKTVREEVSVEFGKYLSTSCQGCHRENMKGGDPIAPGFPVVLDISSTGNPGKWTTEQFISTLRTGVTPEGRVLKPEEMPWPMAKEMTDTELSALHLYLKSL